MQALNSLGWEVPMMQATPFEYKHRYLIHGLIYTLCLAAPWPDYANGYHGVVAWSSLRNASVWFRLTDALSRPHYDRFAPVWNILLVAIALFAAAGATLRMWGASYLGASTVQRGGMVGDGIVADGPFRYTRNPLYLGTILHTVALCSLMRPEAAVLCLLLITVLQFRLIGREEPFLTERLDNSYLQYLRDVPRLLPSLRPRAASGSTTPSWSQGLLSEFYMIGVAVSFAALGWTNGFGWENASLLVLRGIIVSLGLSIVVRAFIPKASY